MHQIQRYILKQLTISEYGRFSKLRPPRTDSNLFSYHLKALMHDGLVRKCEAGYTLSPNGMAYIDRISLERFEPRLQPKILTVLVLITATGKVLLQMRTKQPFIGLLALPSGKLHFGESPQVAATRELQEKTALCGVPLRHAGDAYINHFQSGTLISAVLAHVFRAVVDADGLEGEWYSPELLEEMSLLPGTLELIKLAADSTDHFFTVLDTKH